VAFLPDLAIEDEKTVPALVATLFMKSLADTISDSVVKHAALVSVWRRIASLEVGKILTHMAFCVNLGVMSQASVKPLYDTQQYIGCMLVGDAYSIAIGQIAYVPQDIDTLKESLRLFSTTSLALKAISTLAGTNVENAKSMREVDVALDNGIPLETSVISTIRTELRHLSFPQKYWDPTPANLTRAITFLSTPETPIPNNLPMHHSAVLDHDHTRKVLALFGFMVPTFSLSGAPVIPLGIHSTPPKLYFRMVTIDAAVTDWKDILNTHTIRNNPSGSTSVYQDRILQGSDKTEVWGALVNYSNSLGGSDISVQRDTVSIGDTFEF